MSRDEFGEIYFIVKTHRGNVPTYFRLFILNFLCAKKRETFCVSTRTSSYFEVICVHAIRKNKMKLCIHNNNGQNDYLSSKWCRLNGI